MIEEHNNIHNSIIETSPNIHSEQIVPQKLRFEPLNLAEDQLFSRIKSLKDFETYQRTKIQRINLKNTEELKKSPLLNFVDLLGKKRKENKVLAEYINSQIEETKSPNTEMTQPRYLERRSEQKKERVTPIFINFKLKQMKQLGKVAKLLKQATQQSFMPLIQRCRSQSKTIPVNHEDSVQTPIPKELLRLKRSLKMHPVFKLKRRLTIDASRIGCESDVYENQQSNSIQKANERENSHEKDYLGKVHNFDLKKIQSYLDLYSIRHSSFRKNSSSKFLNLNVDSQISPEKMHQNLTTKRKLQIKINSIIKHDDTSSNQLIGRWPSYSQFDLTEDQARVEKIILKFKRQTENNVDLDQSHYRLHQKIEDEFRTQQQLLDQNVLGERNPLGAKFSHYLRLEKDAYKKNIKQLEHYRRFMKVEKQRHEVWANGIKRLKKY